MSDSKTKVLLIVEGEKTDVKLMNHLFNIYGIGETHSIVSYKTNIYTLYKQMFIDKSPDELDIQNILLENTTDEDEREILKDNYSDVIIVFDLDPQDSRFTKESITEMQGYFNESTDMGKLYINYPMVEAFYHMEHIPDENYYTRTVDMRVLIEKTYKQLVNRENRNHDYNKYAVDLYECNTIIKQNVNKAYYIIRRENEEVKDVDYNSVAGKEMDILQSQLESICNGYVYVLCCCVFYICDFNSKLVYGKS